MNNMSQIKVKDKIFNLQDNNGEKSLHKHASSDIEGGAVEILNKGNPTTAKKIRENIGIKYGTSLPDIDSVEKGDIFLKRKTSNPIPIAEGGTGYVTKFDVCQNLNLIGVDVITNAENDDPSFWADLGTGVVFMKGKYLLDQPTYQGFVHNQVYKDVIYQVWYALGGLGEVYVRSGDLNGWHSVNNIWVRMHNQNTVNRRIFTGELKPGSRRWVGEELSNYTLFKIRLEGKGTNILCSKQGKYIRGMGGYTDTDSSMTTYQVNCEIEDEEYLRCLYCNQITHAVDDDGSAGGEHRGFMDNVIFEIYGLV